MKKKGKEIQINIHLTNRWLYTLIAIGILAIIGVGVYALSPGVAPNPGHSISDVAPPSGCTANQVLQWTGSSWTCANQTQVTSLSGVIMGAFILQYTWGPGTTYSGYDADAAINVNGNGLKFQSSRCSISWGVANNCACPSGYNQALIPGGVGTLQIVNTGSGGSVTTNFAGFCIKQ